MQVLVHQLIANEDIRRQVDQEPFPISSQSPLSPLARSFKRISTLDCCPGRSPKLQKLLHWRRRRSGCRMMSECKFSIYADTEERIHGTIRSVSLGTEWALPSASTLRTLSRRAYPSLPLSRCCNKERIHFSWTEAFKVMIQDRVNRPRKHAEERESGEGTVLW